MELKHLRCIPGLALTIALSACANFDSIHREDAHPNPNSGKLVLIDIKQRGISINASGKSVPTDPDVICAEPFPDALTVFSESIAASGSTPQQISASLSAAFSESGSFVGIRTAAIQALRDQTYRWCEGYSSGAISKAQFTNMHKRYTKLVTAILAIEQLTGAVSTSPVLVTTSSAAGVSKNLLEIQNSLQDATKTLGTAQASLKTLKDNLATAEENRKKIVDANSEEAKKADQAIELLKKQATDKEKEVGQDQETVDGLTKLREAALKSVEASVSASGKIEASEAPKFFDSSAAQRIAEVSKEIAVDALQLDVGATSCIDFMLSIASGETKIADGVMAQRAAAALIASCQKIMDNSTVMGGVKGDDS